MKSGFSSFELIVAMAMSAVIMTCVFEIYNQVTRNMIRVDRFVFEDTQLLALKSRFGKDIAGLSAIWFTQGEVETKQVADGQKMEAPEKRKRSNYFYSVNKNNHLDTLTFITTNALQSYGTTQDRFVRVLYKVEDDPKHAGLFRLMRKEIKLPTKDIDDQVLKQGTFYELVGGIKSIEMMYQLIDKIELQKQYQEQAKLKTQGVQQQSQEKQQEKKPIIRSVKQWGAPTPEKKEELQGEEKEEKSENLGGAAVPKFIMMKIVFGATDKQLEKEYKLEFYIPATVDNIPKNIFAIKRASAGIATQNPSPKIPQENQHEDQGGTKSADKKGKPGIADIDNSGIIS